MTVFSSNPNDSVLGFGLLFTSVGQKVQNVTH